MQIMQMQRKCSECGISFYGKKCPCGSLEKGNVRAPITYRCYVTGCNEKADERRGESVWMCYHHSEEWILKTQPYSLQAEIISNAKRMAKEAKDAEMSNFDYFRAFNPRGYDFFKKMTSEEKTKLEGRGLELIGDRNES